MQHLFDSLIRIQAIWIQIKPQCACEHRWVLRDHCNLASQVWQVHLRDIDTVNQYLALNYFDDT